MPTRSPTGSDVRTCRRLTALASRRLPATSPREARRRHEATETAAATRRWPARRRRGGATRPRSPRPTTHGDGAGHEAEPRQPADVVSGSDDHRRGATNGSSITKSGCGSLDRPEPPRRQAELAAGLPHAGRGDEDERPTSPPSRSASPVVSWPGPGGEPVAACGGGGVDGRRLHGSQDVRLRLATRRRRRYPSASPYPAADDRAAHSTRCCRSSSRCGTRRTTSSAPSTPPGGSATRWSPTGRSPTTS